MITRKPVPTAAQQVPVEDHSTQSALSLHGPEDADGWEEAANSRHGGGGGMSEPSPSQMPHPLTPRTETLPRNIELEENVWQNGAAPASSRPVLSNITIPNSGIPGALTPTATGRSRSETNPFLKAQRTGNSVDESAPLPLQPSMPPQPPPPLLSHPPSRAFSQMSTNEQSNNPWQPALDEVGETKSPSTQTPLQPAQESQDEWASVTLSQQTDASPDLKSPALISLASTDDSAAWEEEAQSPAHTPIPGPTSDSDNNNNNNNNNNIIDDSHAWDDAIRKDKGKGKAVDLPYLEELSRADDSKATDPNFLTAHHPEHNTKPPNLPPRSSNATVFSSSAARTEINLGETYQIKSIRWLDVNATQNIRTSPILLQNKNGPCPLVALVNALSLSTPADDEDVMLVQMLRSREHVSLKLLLDGVIDELMAGARVSPNVTLPDMSDLYEFLKGLHTGMNVDPRFIPTEADVKALKRTSLTHIHPHERGDLIPGTFERAEDLDLYAVFGIPLFHGWLPARDEVAYQAFERRARSYEDAQRLLCGEEDLERKLTSSYEALTESEQEVYQDMLTIRSFLLNWSNQITPWGVEVITKTLQPGSVAILFRNNHFTTLYRHPQTLQLMALVTDAGYASHEDVVWESLVDVNGERAEFFSGDFRVVGGATTTHATKVDHSHHGDHRPPPPPSSTDRAEWPEREDNNDIKRLSDGRQTAQRASNGGSSQQNSASDRPDRPISPSVQEDADLALAIQLQEEEDQRAREDRARRQHEANLTEHFIEQQHRIPAVTIPNRRTSSSTVSSPYGSGSTNSIASTQTQGLRRPSHALASQRSQQQVRPLVPPAVSSAASLVTQTQTPRQTNERPAVHRPVDDGAEDAPPSYEQASMIKAWNPPIGHPSHQSSPASARTSRQSVVVQPSQNVSSQNDNSQNGNSQGGNSQGGNSQGIANRVSSSQRNSQGIANRVPVSSSQSIADSPTASRQTLRRLPPVQQPSQMQGDAGRGTRMPTASPGGMDYERARDDKCVAM